MTTNDFNASMRSNCLGCFVDKDGDDVVLYVQFNEINQTIEVGTACNVGLLVDFTVPYDDDFSLDENLQSVADAIYENGYTDLN